MGQISSDRLKKTFACLDSMPFFPLAPCYNIFARACAEIKISRYFLDEKVTYICTSLGSPFFFLRLSSFSFSYLFATVIDLQLGLLSVKKFWESVIGTGNFYHGVAMCICRQFWSEFFSESSEHFRTKSYFRLHLADHSDLGIIRKIFSSCRTWGQMMPILCKGYGVRREIN